jgi:hypothetical protein
MIVEPFVRASPVPCLHEERVRAVHDPALLRSTLEPTGVELKTDVLFVADDMVQTGATFAAFRDAVKNLPLAPGAFFRFQLFSLLQHFRTPSHDDRQPEGLERAAFIEAHGGIVDTWRCEGHSSLDLDPSSDQPVQALPDRVVAVNEDGRALARELSLRRVRQPRAFIYVDHEGMVRSAVVVPYRDRPKYARPPAVNVLRRSAPAAADGYGDGDSTELRQA